MSRPIHIVPVMLSIVAMSGLCDVALAGSVMLTPVSQDRGVSGFVIVPPCGAPQSAGDSQDAADFGPFDAAIDVQKVCEAAHGIAQAAQQSQIGMSSMSATGSAAPQAFSTVGTVIHAMPNSLFKVTFEISQPARFSLTANLSASGALPIIVSKARVRLGSGAGDAVTDPVTAIVDQSVVPGAGGAEAGLNVSEQAILQPGTYNLRAEAVSWIDSTVPPSGSGSAAYDIGFELFSPADLNLDTVVDTLDLGILLSSWTIPPAKSCASPCPADLNGDGVVNTLDLGILLAGWTL